MNVPWRTLRRLALFVLLPVASAIASILGIPAVTTAYGESGWAAIAVGTAVGTALSVFVEIGWAVTGPVRAARAVGDAAVRLLVTASATKVLALIPAAAVSAGVAALIVQEHRLAAMLAGVAGACLGASAAWFFIGRARPMAVLAIDIMPRIIAAGVASLILSAGGPLESYPLALIVGSCISVLLAVLVMRPTLRSVRSALTWPRIAHSYRSQVVATRGQIATALYTATPIVIVGIVAPGAVAVFSAAERLQRMALALLRSVPNALVGWVASVGAGPERVRRIRDSVLVSAALGLGAGGFYALLAPWAAGVIFSGVVVVTPQLAALGGVLIFIVSLSRAIGGIGLVVMGRVDAVARSAVIGALVGVPALLVAPRWWGPVGGIVAEIVTEAVVLGVQIAALLRHLRGRRT